MSDFLGHNEPAPPGYFVIDDGGSVPVEIRRKHAKAREEARKADLAAEREIKPFKPTPLHGEPTDIVDAALLAVAAEPWRMHGSGPTGEKLTMDTDAAKRERKRARLDEERAKVEQTIARVSGEPDEDDEDTESAYDAWVKEGLKLDKTIAEEEDEEYRRQEKELEEELEREANWT
jgi:hypothetical protein